MKQRTICKEVEFSGKGLHLGQEVHLKMSPAPANTGIVFVRVDLSGKPRIPVFIDNLYHRTRRTALVVGDAEIQTPEHLLAACCGAGIDNLEIEMDGPEVPGADGSAQPFIATIDQAGVKEQEAEKNFYVLQEKVSVSGENAHIEAVPYEDGLVIEYLMDHDVDFLPRQEMKFTFSPENFRSQIAPARTFVLYREVELLKRAGLGKGANTSNTLVIGEDGKVLENELRFSDEFIRHKILDLIGDLLLLGQPLKAYVKAQRSGHALNAALVKELTAKKRTKTLP